MSIALDILIVGSAAVTGCGAGWWLRGARSINLLRDQSDKLQAEVEKNKQEIANALQEAENAKNQAKVARNEAANFKLEAAQTKRDLDAARKESLRAHEALSQLQNLATRIAADVGEHNTCVQAISAGLEEGAGTSDVVVAVAKLIEANAQMQEKLETAEQRLQRQAQELETHIVEARTDALTGLANRRAFDGELARLEGEFHGHGRTSSVMMVDVDHFKKFNDTHGHQAGDEVLRGVARVLKERIQEQGMVCRYGGEEFAIIFAGQQMARARALAEKSRAAIADSVFEHDGVLLRVTASGGVAEFMRAETAEEMVRRADEALYACKSAGRNCGFWHDGERCHAMTPRVEQANAARSHKEQPTSAPTASAEAPAGEADAALSTKDAVTGLASRQTFVDDMQRRLAEARRGGAALSVMLVEVDRFERLTKAFGLSAGDTMLKATAQFLKATMRDMDHVARWDHRQFALLLPCATIDDAKIVGERLRSAIENCKLPVHGGVLQFTISVGATQVINDDDMEAVMTRARSAVREASHLGGNRAIVWNEADMASSGAAENTT